ncbi:SRPBCC family protein [Amycolatopsis panacis]|uniref:SRPBCC family protein n=1 Tax=Amycolatopsis panacis TaxID=2340917 RepID=UPI00269865BB|nr:SRPBCC domain-containing protein [Amycolatopsis panacis]
MFTFRWAEPDDEVGETVVTITFAGRDGKTEMTFHQAPFPNAAEREGHRHGWQSGFEDLAATLAEGR